MWIRASDLAEGMRTTGGLEVTEVRFSSGLVYVTFDGFRSGIRKQTISYIPNHEFDIAAKEVPTQMAQRVITEVLSDLSGKPDAMTMSFGLDGTVYEIDLTEDEASKFRGALAKYVGAARTVKAKPKANKNTRSGTGPSARDIRTWAAENGLDVPERGRIPEAVKAEYEAAHAA